MAKESTEDALILRDITVEANAQILQQENSKAVGDKTGPPTLSQVTKRGRGRPRKVPAVPVDIGPPETQGEKSGGHVISDSQMVSNLQSISSVINNVDERDQKESQKDISVFNSQNSVTDMEGN